MKRIVVGIDGSEGSRIALEWALEEARTHDATLEAVLAWSYLDQHVATGTEGFDPEYSEENARAALDDVIEKVAGTDPDVRVVRTVVNDLPARTLLDVAKDANLLVVGSRGHGGFRGLLLGSVSQQCVNHSPCPIVVVPHDPDRR